MKKLTVLLSCLWFLSFSGYSVEDKTQACSTNINSELCQAYIAGLVDGYIASKQQTANFENKYANRAYETRVGNTRIEIAHKSSKCISEDNVKKEVEKFVVQLKAQDDVVEELASFLRHSVSCDKKAKQ